MVVLSIFQKVRVTHAVETRTMNQTDYGTNFPDTSLRVTNFYSFLQFTYLMFCNKNFHISAGVHGHVFV